MSAVLLLGNVEFKKVSHTRSTTTERKCMSKCVEKECVFNFSFLCWHLNS